MIKTDLCKHLKIRYPIIQGGMAWVSTPELVSAVSNAGGLGILGAGNAPPELILKHIQAIKAKTNNPFGLNIYYLSPHAEDIVDIAISEKLSVVTTGAGNPGKHIRLFKDKGIAVLPVVASVALARRLERQGVDGIIGEGMECGGHVGEITTFSLISQLVDAVKIPVIAAGGIADGRGFAAALALGAQGVQMGTRFICSAECAVHDNYKKAIIAARDRDTVLSGPPGHKVRVLKNKLTREFEILQERGASLDEFEALGTGKLRAAVVDGDIEFGSLMSGQIAGMIKNVKPVAEIIEETIREAEQIIDMMHKRIINKKVGISLE